MIMLVFSFLVAVVFATLLREDMRSRTVCAPEAASRRAANWPSVARSAASGMLITRPTTIGPTPRRAVESAGDGAVRGSSSTGIKLFHLDRAAFETLRRRDAQGSDVLWVFQITDRAQA